MKIVRDILSLSLATSGLVGAEILLTDMWLWSVAPSHAYGLIGFILGDLLLVAASLKRISLAALGAAFTSTFQFGAMFGDLVTGAPAGTPSIAFKNYLLGDASYIVLLLIQVAIAIIAIEALIAPILHKHARSPAFLHFPRS